MHQTSWLLLIASLLGVSTVDVSAQDMIISGPENATVCKGGVATFDCGYISGSTLLWFINGTIVQTRGIIENGQSQFPLEWLVNGSNTNTTRLKVGPVDGSICGNTTFRCEIQSNMVVSSDIATLVVIGTAPIPTITVLNVGMTTITISWTIPEYDPSDVCGLVMYRVAISGLEFNDMDTTSANMYMFTELTPNTNYTITVTPYNKAGDGTPNSTVVLTLPTVPLPPTDVRLSLKFDDGRPNINASWMAPQLKRTMTEVEEYNLTLYINGSSQATTIVPANTTMVDIFTVFGPNITRERYTDYSLSVAAINRVGQGDFSERALVATRYIQEASAIPGVGMITLSCTTALSVPAVRCDADILCDSKSSVKPLTNGNNVDYDTNETCDISISVRSRSNLNKILEQRNFNDVMPSVQPSTTATTLEPSPTVTPTTGERRRDDDDDDDTGTIVAIIIGILVCLGLLIALIIVCICWCRYRKRRELALVPCAIKCTCCTCLLCLCCAKKRRGSMKPMTTGEDKTDTGNSNSSGDSRDSPNSTDAFVMKENMQPEAGYCEVAPKKQVKHDNGITSEYSVVGSEGNPTKNAPQPVALYSEVEPAPKKNGLVPATSVPSQYSMITQEEDTDTNNTVEGMPMYSQVDKSKKTIKVQQLPEYSIVHKPTKVEGKVENYSDLADIGPYPTKRPPQDKVQYTEVTPSDATPPDSGTQYTNVDHINDGPIHLSTDHKVQYSVVQ